MKKLFLTLIFSVGKKIPASPFRRVSPSAILPAFLVIMVVIMVSGATGCSDDDEPSTFVNTSTTEVSFVEINKCDIGGGVYYTEYFFAIPYETGPNQEIDKIIYSVKASGDPNMATEKEKSTFQDTGTKINFSLCLKFGAASSLDFKTSLVSKDNTKSAPRTHIIIRPQGAN